VTQQNNNPPQNRPGQPANPPAQNSGSRFGSATPPAPGARPGTTPAPAQSTSRFGNPPAQQSQQQGQQRPGFPSTPRPPFGASTRLEWHIVPVTRTLVKFELNGLGDPFHRLLGMPMNPQYGDMKGLLKALEQGGEPVESLRAHLEAVWQSYGLMGAMLMYNTNAGLGKAISVRGLVDKIVPLTNNKAANSTDDDDDDETTPPAPDDGRDNATLYRAIDLALALNVLGRTRSTVLMCSNELSFDHRLLERSIITDDARLVGLARATGCIEELKPG
jgi:hypothetical protein